MWCQTVCGCGQVLPAGFVELIIFAIRGTKKGEVLSLRGDSRAQGASAAGRTRQVEEAASLCRTSKALGLSQDAKRDENSGLHTGMAWVSAWQPCGSSKLSSPSRCLSPEEVP